MLVTFYQNNSDARQVSKSITPLANKINCNWKENTSIVNPVIYVSKVILENYASCNYMFIPEFNRYYYISNIVLEAGNILRITAYVDVLMSNRSDIGGIRCIIARSETVNNKYFVDPMCPVRTKRAIKYIPIGQLVQNKCYIMTGDGGENIPES